MKKLFYLIVLSVLALPVFGQSRTINTFSAKGFAKATSRTDTSLFITVGAYPIVSIQTTTDGTDSANISVHVDGQVNGLWSNDITVASAVTLGKATGYSLEAKDTGQVANFLLREANGRIADLLKQCAAFRIRNILTSGAGDSVHTTTYTQNVMLQKVTW
jgi:hypothetical protein